MKLWKSLLAVSFLFAIACTNSDDYLYSESDSTPISISAKMAPELDSINQQSKADTIRIGDTLTFIADISPSRSIRMQRYYWTLDGEMFATEFSFRRGFDNPGHHTIALVLIDFFGDTLTDTLNVWAGNPPLLNDSVFIPQNGTQGIPIEGGISFAWNAYDPDSLYDLHYHFTLSNSNRSTEIDTIVKEPFFTYKKSLEPLQAYYWQVTAINELNFASKNSISGKFFTKGSNDESGIIGEIKTSIKDIRINSIPMTIKVQVTDSTGDTVQTASLKYNSASPINFRIIPLNPGKYKISATAENFSDYTAEPLSIQVSNSEIHEVPPIVLSDTIAPSIRSVDVQGSDTLNYSDTLKFLITDGGDTISNERVFAYLEDKAVPATRLSKDTFAVPLPTSAKSINYRLLTLNAIDISNNSTQKTFRIKPALQWFECNNDTTLSGNGIIEIYVRDTNPMGFEPDSFFFSIFNNSDYIAIGADGRTEYTFRTLYTTFTQSTNPIKTGIRYKNGIVKWFNWNIYIESSAKGSNE